MDRMQYHPIIRAAFVAEDDAARRPVHWPAVFRLVEAFPMPRLLACLGAVPCHAGRQARTLETAFDRNGWPAVRLPFAWPFPLAGRADGRLPAMTWYRAPDGAPPRPRCAWPGGA